MVETIENKVEQEPPKEELSEMNKFLSYGMGGLLGAFSGALGSYWILSIPLIGTLAHVLIRKEQGREPAIQAVKKYAAIALPTFALIYSGRCAGRQESRITDIKDFETSDYNGLVIRSADGRQTVYSRDKQGTYENVDEIFERQIEEAAQEHAKKEYHSREEHIERQKNIRGQKRSLFELILEKKE